MTRFVPGFLMSALVAVGFDAAAAEPVSLAEVVASAESYHKKDVATEASVMMVTTPGSVLHCKKKEKELSILPPLVDGKRPSVGGVRLGVCVAPDVAEQFQGKPAGTPIIIYGTVRVEKDSGVIKSVMIDRPVIELKPTPKPTESDTLF